MPYTSSSSRRDPLREIPAYGALLCSTLSHALRTPLAGRVVSLLLQHESMTLGEMAKALKEHAPPAPHRARKRRARGGGTNPQQRRRGTVRRALPPAGLNEALYTDLALRELVTRLYLHRVVCFDAKTKTYALQPGTSLLLQLYYPLVLLELRRRFGVAGERVGGVVRQLAVAPLDAAVRTAAEAAAAAGQRVASVAAVEVATAARDLIGTPPVAAATSAAHIELGFSSEDDNRALQGDSGRSISTTVLRDEWMCAMSKAARNMLSCGVFDVLSTTTAAPAAQRRRTESGTVTSGGADGLPCVYVQWNVCYLSQLLLHSAMMQLGQERLADRLMGSVVLQHLLALEEDVVRRSSSRHHNSSNHYVENVDGMPGMEPEGSSSAAAVGGAGLDALGFPIPPPATGTASASFHTLLNEAQRRIGGLQSETKVKREDQHTEARAAGAVSFANTNTTAVAERLAAVLEALKHPTSASNGLQHPSDGAGLTSVCRGGLLTPSAVHHSRENTDWHSAFFSSGPVETDPEAAVSIHYAAFLRCLSLEMQEKVIFARHGVLGVRIVALLRHHHFLEDRSIAELVVSPQPQTREALHDLLRDGIVIQKEISKVDANPTSERQPKHQIYLWGLEVPEEDRGNGGNRGPTQRSAACTAATTSSAVLIGIRQTVGLALLHVLEKLEAMRGLHAEAEEAASSSGSSWSLLPHVDGGAAGKRNPPAGDAAGAATGAGSSGTRTEARDRQQQLAAIRDVEATAQRYREIIGLESAALGYMRMLFVLDYEV
eukprot:gene1384-808_t